MVIQLKKSIKTESIRGILEPISEQVNIYHFKIAGFKDFTTI